MYGSTREIANKEFENVRSGIAALASPARSPVEERQPRMEGIDAFPQRSRLNDESAPPALNASSLFSYLKSTANAAQKKVAPALKELAKAEDTADEYLNKWGASFGQMLKDAVSIAPPQESDSLNTRDDGVLFDSGKETGSKCLPLASCLLTILI